LVDDTGAESAQFLATEVHVDREPTRLRLAGANLSAFEVEACRFVSCDLQGATLDDALIEDTEFVECNLALVSFGATRLQDVTFRACKLSGVDFTRLGTSLIGSPLRFEDCVMVDTNFVSASFAGSTFLRCDLAGADFAGADLSRCDLTGSVLRDARFEQTNLTDAHLEGATEYRISPTNNRVRNLHVSLPDLIGLVLPFGVKIVDAPVAEPGPR
jgi:fluoroquinolone resistance protein